MFFLKFFYILLIVHCHLALPIDEQIKTQDEKIKKSNGLTTTISPSRNVPTTKPLLTILTRVKPSTNLTTQTSRQDALYQMANNLLQKEKNWLQTEKWLIDNVYRLKNELTDLKRELGSQKRSNLLFNQKSTQIQYPSTNNANFIQDIGSLRADHSVISQQQQQIIQITRDNQQQLISQSDLLKQLTTMVKEQIKSVASISQAMVSLQQINDTSNGNTNQLINKLMYDLSALSTTTSVETEQIARDAENRMIKSKQPRSRISSPRILQLLKAESQFDGRTEGKLGQLSQEMKSLHSMTIDLSKNLADLQKHIIKNK